MSPSGSDNRAEQDQTNPVLGGPSAISSTLALVAQNKADINEMPESVAWNPDTKTEVIESINTNQMVPQIPTSLPLDQVCYESIENILLLLYMSIAHFDSRRVKRHLLPNI